MGSYAHWLILVSKYAGDLPLHTLRKKGSSGFYICSIGFFTQFQRTVYAKKGSIMTRMNPFGTKVLYRILFNHILHYSATKLNCCSN